MVRGRDAGEVIEPNVRAVLDTRSVGGAIEDAVAALVGVVGDSDTVDTVTVKDTGLALAGGVATVVEGPGAVTLLALIPLCVVAETHATSVLAGGGVAAVGNTGAARVKEVNRGADVPPGQGAVLNTIWRVCGVDDALATVITGVISGPNSIAVLDT